jgi:hypothetical protein
MKEEVREMQPIPSDVLTKHPGTAAHARRSHVSF